jgi:Glycerol dehydrogenase and related enzymes
MATFTKIKSMYFPRNVLIGHNAIHQVVDVCQSLRFGKKGIIITGQDTYKAAGCEIEERMSKEYDLKTIFTGNATPENVKEVSETVKSHEATFMLAIGGGSKIDISKIVAKDLDLPFVSVPTSVSHDGIASDRASLKSDSGAQSVEAVAPIGIIADTTVINEAPYRFLASGCADVISNLTALKDWEFASWMRDEEMSSSAFMISKYAAENIIENSDRIKPGLEESVWLIMRPIVASGVSMCIAGNSRPTSGSEHMFSHALDIIRPNTALHGEQCGMGAIMMMHLHGGDWKRIRDALVAIGAPTTAAETGFTEDDIVDALVMAKDIRRERFTILGDKGLTRTAAKNLARVTKVI